MPSSRRVQNSRSRRRSTVAVKNSTGRLVALIIAHRTRTTEENYKFKINTTICCGIRWKAKPRPSVTPYFHRLGVISRCDRVPYQNFNAHCSVLFRGTVRDIREKIRQGRVSWERHLTLRLFVHSLTMTVVITGAVAIPVELVYVVSVLSK